MEKEIEGVQDSLNKKSVKIEILEKKIKFCCSLNNSLLFSSFKKNLPEKVILKATKTSFNPLFNSIPG